MLKKLLLSLKGGVPFTHLFLHKRSLAALCLVLFSFASLQAQVSLYTFQQEMGTYTPLGAEATVVAAATSTAAADRFDGQNWNVNLPFSFPFNGVNYSTATVNSNGYLTLGGTLSTSTSNPINNTTNLGGVISILGADLAACFSTEHVGQLLTGTRINGSQNVFVVEFKNWQRWATSTSDYNVIQMQIHLHEDGTIKLVYGSIEIIGNYTGSAPAQIGLRGATNTDFNNRKSVNTVSFSSSTRGTNNGDTQGITLNSTASVSIPSNGLTYTYSPPSCFAPTVPVVSQITANSFTITCSSTSSPSFEYEIRTDNNPGVAGAGLVASGDNMIMPNTITGLTQGTSYQIYVRTICTEGRSSWSNISATTLCGIFEVPYLQGFNQATIANCWTSVLAGGTSSNLSYVTAGTNPSAATFEGSGMVRYNSYSANATSSERLISPPINTVGQTALINEFAFYHSSSYANSLDSLIVEYSVDNGATWVRFGAERRYRTTSGWSTKTYSLPAGALNQANLKIAYLFKSGNGQSMYIDAMHIKAPPAPTYTSNVNFTACTAEPIEATINGIGLSNAVVTVDGVEKALTLNNFDQIKFMLTAGTFGEVVISTPTGSITLPDFVDIMTPPTLSLSLDEQLSCTGEAVNLTLTSPIDNFTTYTWNTTATNTVTGTAATGYEVTSPSTYAFIITGTVEIEGLSCVSRDTFTYTAVANPAAIPNFTEITLCEEEIQTINFVTTPIQGPTSGSPNPFHYNYGGLRLQQMYRAEELTALGWTADNPITSLSFTVSEINPTLLENYRVRIGQTDITALSSTFESSDLVTVFQGDVQPHLGVNTFNFNTNFIWDGTSNVILEFAFSNEDRGMSSPSNMIEYQLTTYNASVYKQLDLLSAETIYNTPEGRAEMRRTVFTFGGVTPMTPISPYNVVWEGANIYLDETAIIPITGQNTPAVYFKAGTTSETITATLTNNNGCVTNLSYTINVNPFERVSITDEACGYYQHLGEILTSTGQYIDTLTSMTGCDSIITLNLTVIQSAVYYVDITSCTPYIFDGQQLTASGTYSATYTSTNGCADSTVHLTLTMVDQLTTYVTHQGNTLTAHPSGENVIYQWEDCNSGMVIPGANQRTFTPAEYGIYRVRVANGNCSGVSMCVVYSTMGISIVDDLSLTIAPNPTRDNVTITYESEEEMELRIYDAAGKSVSATKILSGSTINLSELVSGVYILQVSDASSSRTTRIVKI